MKSYLELVREVLEHGTHKENRTGVDTISTFNVNYEVDLSEGSVEVETHDESSVEVEARGRGWGARSLRFELYFMVHEPSG